MYLSQVRLLVSDFDVSFRFYRDVLRLRAAMGAEGEGYAEFVTGDDASAIALLDRQQMAAAVGDLGDTTARSDRFNLCLNVENVDAAAKQLRQRGVQFVTEPTDRPDWMGRTAHFRDPDGNLIELYQLLH
jgi:catechol 2,3-dioxygenase-like lactoylglutathione lyase family enzyme